MAFPDGWGRRCQISISSTYIDGDLTDYVFTMNLSNTPSEMYDADGSYPANADGGDIRGSNDQAGTSQIEMEIYYFLRDNDPANGLSEIHCLVPSVSSASGASIWLWYNNSGASMPASDSTYGSENVWADYDAVFHLGADVDDSTASGITGTNQGTSEDTTESMLGRSSREFLYNQNDYIDYGDVLDINGDVDFTALAMIMVDSYPSEFQTVVSRGDRQYHLAYNEFSSDFEAVMYNGSSWLTSTFDSNPAVDTWAQLSMRRSASSNTLTNNLNGVDGADTETVSTIATNAYDFYIGENQEETGRYFDGWMEEVRVAEHLFSEDYLAATWDNWNDPGNFASAGTPESPAAAGVASRLVNPRSRVKNLVGGILA